MKLLVIGATGGTGRELVRQALEHGHAVTAFVRNPRRLRIEHERLTMARGNVLDAASVDAAVRGQEAVLCALGHKRWFYPTTIQSEGTRNVIRAMEANKVRRFVCETALGISDSWWRGGLYYTLFLWIFILPFYFIDKARQERVIRASALDWIIVRPGLLTSGRKRGVRRQGPKVGSWFWTVMIPRADVAAFMLDQLTDDRYLHSAPGVC
jgi:uncharacterized protein YbjT (DUF2867 family)